MQMLSNHTRKLLTKALEAIAEEGCDAWGFLFVADNPNDEASPAMLETFSSRNDDPVPLFITKTKRALYVIQNVMPVGFDLPAAEEAVAKVVEGHLKSYDDMVDELLKPKKPN
jgi:hypothetical protein